ncbi:M16 family metallopeptidase [Sphingomonas xanthus]|uniref:Insulinase family protein n=1 Tax=Sphingomonas xanthus TaxID=2594473 RepID=A0A516IS20_9SPHN|nr:pitrilysin family protein [Sphingomonas xanthus]QDP19702.1 insulinase family protein [Sphingomonas xanthus]
MVELTRLANGVTVAIDPMAGAQSAAIGLYAAVGSRSEADGKGGLAHLVEHMVFKGARGRDARAIAEAIEDVGGSLNAWTARDQTVFHARTLAPDVGLALELIADLVRAPRLDENELEREKLVILSELGECLDAPDDVIHDRLFEAAFGDQPLARPILGTEASIRALSRSDCTGWLDQQYRPERLVISAAGKVNPSHILLLAEALFGDLEAMAPPEIAPALFSGGIRADRRPSEQTHVGLAFPGVAASHPDAPALALFAQAVGGGMSSRLFQELREDRGLAYSIYSWTQGFAETGVFAINLSADKARALEALNLARDTVERAAADLTDAELARARAQVEAGILMALETPQGRADAMARSLEIFGRVMTIEEMLVEVRAVDAAAARAAGVAMLSGPRAIASVGGKLALAA